MNITLNVIYTHIYMWCSPICVHVYLILSQSLSLRGSMWRHCKILNLNMRNTSCLMISKKGIRGNNGAATLYLFGGGSRRRCSSVSKKYTYLHFCAEKRTHSNGQPIFCVRAQKWGYKKEILVDEFVSFARPTAVIPLQITARENSFNSM